MRQWTPQPTSNSFQALGGLIGLLGDPAFESTLLQYLHPVVPAASYSIYQTGKGCAPQLFMSASLGVPDTTRDCWKAYLSGPYRTDRSLVREGGSGTALCHITAQEVSAEHRARVYEAHGVSERISVIRQDAASVFAINFYRHTHQTPFLDAHLSAFDALAPTLISLVQKHIDLSQPAKNAFAYDVVHWTHKLQQRHPELTARELEVCARLLTGMTQDGIASDLGLGLPTVKTYRNRAFNRLGIHFRNELFALLH